MNESTMPEEERIAYLRSVSKLRGNENFAFLIRLLDEAEARAQAAECNFEKACAAAYREGYSAGESQMIEAMQDI